MTASTFFAQEQNRLVSEAVARIESPEDLLIRIVDFERDRKAIGEAPREMFVDTVDPAFGMVAADCSNELTLMAEKGGRVIGQISADFEMAGRQSTNLDLHVSGIFVALDERGKRIGEALGLAMLEVAEAWRRVQAAAAGRGPRGEIDVTADTEAGSGGEAIINTMIGRSGELSEISFDEAETPQP